MKASVLAQFLVGMCMAEAFFPLYSYSSHPLSPKQRPGESFGRHVVVSFWKWERRKHTLLWMGKGDGKKKRKKKKATPTPTMSTTPSSSHEPLRVTSDSNIPVRQQLAWAKLNKQYRQQSGGSFRQKRVERTSYRRKWDEEEIEQKAQERARRGQEPDWDVILNQTAASPLVIIDGYNVIYQWARLKKHMVKGDTARARQLLIDDLENLRVIKGWRIEVVFDGTRRSTTGPLGEGPGSSAPSTMDKAAKKDVTKHGVRVVYSGVGSEADTYIEARCAQAKNVTDGVTTSSFIVATDDSMVRLAATSAGALCMSSGRMVTELKAIKKATSYSVEVAVAKANGHAVRPESLRQSTQFQRFGRRSVLIEDKRNRTASSKRKQEYLDIEVSVELPEDGIPWWAKVPNTTNAYRSQ